MKEKLTSMENALLYYLSKVYKEKGKLNPDDRYSLLGAYLQMESENIKLAERACRCLRKIKEQHKYMFTDKDTTPQEEQVKDWIAEQLTIN